MSLLAGPLKFKRDLILLNGGAGFDVHDRIEAERVREVDVAARHAVAVSVKEQIARQNVDVAEDDGMLPGAADTQVGFGFELRARPLHARIGRGDRLNVELKIAQECGACGGTGNSFFRGDRASRRLPGPERA